MTDRELARAVANGDPEAFLTFVRLYHDSVYRYLSSLIDNEADVEDLAIETMHRARRKAGTYRGDASLRTWVHRIAYRCLTHWHRKRRPTKPLTDDLFLASSDPFTSINDTEALRAALSKLPANLSQTFVLHEVNELPIEDIAHILDVPVGTVKSRLHTARAKLRELLSYPKEEPNAVFVAEPGPAN